MPDGGKLLAATIAQNLGDKNQNSNNNKYLLDKANWDNPETILYTHTHYIIITLK